MNTRLTWICDSDVMFGNFSSPTDTESTDSSVEDTHDKQDVYIFISTTTQLKVKADLLENMWISYFHTPIYITFCT